MDTMILAPTAKTPRKRKLQPVSFDVVTGANQRKKAARPAKTEKRTIDGRILHSHVIATSSGDKVRYFHATKGWRTRPIVFPTGRVTGRRRRAR